MAERLELRLGARVGDREHRASSGRAGLEDSFAEGERRWVEHVVADLHLSV